MLPVVSGSWGQTKAYGGYRLLQRKPVPLQPLALPAAAVPSLASGFGGSCILFCGASRVWRWQLPRRHPAGTRRGGVCSHSGVAVGDTTSVIARAARSVSVSAPPAPSYPGVFRLRGNQSGTYIRATREGDLTHDDDPFEDHFFVIVPGIGPRSGLVRLQQLATGNFIFVTADGGAGAFQGDFEEFYWRLVPGGDDGCFALEQAITGIRLFSNSDGRLGTFVGETYDDQFFFSEAPNGRRLVLSPLRGAWGLQRTGFIWLGGGPEPHVFTDAFHASHFIFANNDELVELRELREVPDSRIKLTMWGAAVDVGLPSMDDPHGWAIENVPLLKRLASTGLIGRTRPGNRVYPERDWRLDEYTGDGLLPSNAIGFALRPVSQGGRVASARGWLRGWHGTGLHSIESLAKEGLRPGEAKGGIFASPSFHSTFCLYCTPDILVDNARFRIVVEVRVRPDSYNVHGDEYSFCSMRHIEPCVPEHLLEWELGDDVASVHVVGLVLKQLGPEHPSLRHDTITRHGCKALLQL